MTLFVYYAHCILSEKTEVLGVLRCNWDEVSNMTGIAVTPVIGFIGDLDELSPHFKTNPDEVQEMFCVPMDDLLGNPYRFDVNTSS